MSVINDIRDISLRHANRELTGETAIGRLKIYVLEQPTDPIPLIYDPVVCLVLQGTKRTVIGDRSLEYGMGDCLVVVAEVAALGQISQASSQVPYVGANLYLDKAMLLEMLVDSPSLSNPPAIQGFSVSKASAHLLDAWRRLMELLDRPDEIPIMAPHLEREVLLWLLMGPHGRLLRQLATDDSHLVQIRRAMDWIRGHYTERLAVEDMASVAGMSASVFHRRFKRVTGQTPLQYQKQMRLNEARRQILSKGASAAAIAFAVGYESASQFSREYKRSFGEPPRRDAAALHTSLTIGSEPKVT